MGNDNKTNVNTFAMMLFILAIIILVLGLIGSVVWAHELSEYGETNWTIFFVGLLSTAIFSFQLFGLAEIIRILDDNRTLLTEITQKNDISSDGTRRELNSMVEELPEI